MRKKRDKIKKVLSVDENFVWVTSNFFYDINKWHLVLLEIEAFLIEVINKDYLQFQVSLNYIPVYNVQLAILCEGEEMMDEIGNKLYRYFTKFKEKYRPKKYIVEVKGIRLPYPSDTFQIGLCTIPFKEKDNAVYEIQKNFSKLIFSGLKVEAFTEEDTHTLAVFSLITLGKAMFNFNRLATSAVFEKLQKEYLSYGFRIKDNFPEEFDEINNLSRQLLAIVDIGKEEPWLADWFWFCKNELNKIISNPSESVKIEDKLSEWYINNGKIILSQLGIPEKTKETLFILINCALVSNT